MIKCLSPISRNGDATVCVTSLCSVTGKCVYEKHRPAMGADGKPRDWRPGERYMLFAKGFGDGAKCSAIKHEDQGDYMAGYIAGREARARDVQRFAEMIGYEPTILRTVGEATEEVAPEDLRAARELLADLITVRDGASQQAYESDARSIARVARRIAALRIAEKEGNK